MNNTTARIHTALDNLSPYDVPDTLIPALQTITDLHRCYCQLPPDPHYNITPHCGRYGHTCMECSGSHGADSTDWPCPTITALAEVWPDGTDTPREP